ncbi:MAG: aminotransferase class IV [Xenococcaceae cyanobacterium]
MYWYNGQLIKKTTLELNINDPALLYGATVFTTMRLYQRSLIHPLTNWKAHCDRLRHSLKTFNWQSPDWDRLQRGAEILSAYFPVLRIAIFPDGRELITGRTLPEDLDDRQKQGITAWVAEDILFQRSQPLHKTGNYLGAILALQKAQKLDALEAILIDDRGNWLETSTGNLWGYKDSCWYTPSLEIGILPGIARSQLLNYLQTQKIPVCENIWTPNFVKSLSAIAYSNCVVELIPIHTVITQSDRLNFNYLDSVFHPLTKYFNL